MNHSGGFPTANWQVFRTGGGDSLGTAFDLPVTAISTGAAVGGEIAGGGGEAHIRWRIDILATATNTGIGYVDTLMYYSATS